MNDQKMPIKQRKVKARTSAVWNYFTDVPADTSGKRFVQCQICKMMVSSAGQTLNLHTHLQRHHRIVVEKRTRIVTQKYNKRNTRKSSLDIEEISINTDTTDEPVQEKSTDQDSLEELSLFELKREPQIIFDDDETIDTICLDLTSPSVSRESSPLSDLPPPLEIIYENEYVDLSSPNSPEEQQQPESTFTTNTLEYENKNMNNAEFVQKISDFCDDIKFRKSVESYTSDLFFYNSIVREIENMSEESKDLVKAAIWRVICKVKSAERKNEDLSIGDLLNSGVI